MKTTLPLFLGVSKGYFVASIGFSSDDELLPANSGRKRKAHQKIHSWSYVLHFNVA